MKHSHQNAVREGASLKVIRRSHTTQARKLKPNHTSSQCTSTLLYKGNSGAIDDQANHTWNCHKLMLQLQKYLCIPSNTTWQEGSEIAATKAGQLPSAKFCRKLWGINSFLPLLLLQLLKWSTQCLYNKQTGAAHLHTDLVWCTQFLSSTSQHILRPPVQQIMQLSQHELHI